MRLILYWRNADAKIEYADILKADAVEKVIDNSHSVIDVTNQIGISDGFLYTC